MHRQPPMRHSSRLRAHRKAAALSQRDLGLLLGYGAQSVISRYESATARPSLTALIGSEILLGVPGRDLFPALYAEVERELAANARRLLKKSALRTERSEAARAALIGRLIPDSTHV
jgi:transcriptional regulator with XRE-family HTH domain